MDAALLRATIASKKHRASEETISPITRCKQGEHMKELPQNVKEALAGAVEVWADDALLGKPAILANIVYMALEKTFIEQANKIKKTFPG